MSSFFRPTVITVSITVVTTLLAAVVLYIMLNCALNGSMGCQLPLWLQIFMIAVVWPMIIVFRFLGPVLGPELSAIVGLVLSGLWIFAVVCTGRWLLHLRRS